MKILLIIAKLILSISYNLRLMKDIHQKIPKEKIKNWKRLEILSKSAQNIKGVWQTITPIKIRKLQVSASKSYYHLQNLKENIVYEFQTEIEGNIILKLMKNGIDENITLPGTKSEDKKKATFEFNNSISEGFYEVIFYENEKKMENTNINILIYKNELLVGSRKTFYQLINTTSSDEEFELEINLEYRIFKEQIDKIQYEYDNSSNSIDILNYRLSEENNSIILTLNKTMKRYFRNYTFKIYNKKDGMTDESTLSFTLIETNFIVLNPIIFMEALQASQSKKNVTFQMQFANNVTSLNSSDIKIFIDGYIQLFGTETFNNSSKKVNLTFTKNTTAAKEYYFVYTNGDYEEYRNIYLANYSMSGGCQELSSPKNIYIDISFTINLQGIVDVAIKSENYSYIFSKYTNTSRIGNLITYTYYFSSVYVIEGNFYLIAISNILNLDDDDDDDNYIDKDNLQLTFFKKYTLNTSLDNNNTIYTDKDNEFVILTFNEKINDIKIQLKKKKENYTINSENCSINNDNTLKCFFRKITKEEEGDYSIYYIGLCDDYIIINDSNVEIKYINNLLSINPPVFIINESSIKNITLIYKEDLSTDPFTLNNIVLDSDSKNIPIDKFIIEKNEFIFNASLNNVKAGIYKIYSNFTNNKSYLSELKLKITENLDLNFKFNHYLFVLNNSNNEYDFNHLLKITPSGSDISLVNSIYYENQNKYLNNGSGYYFDIMNTAGEFTFSYIDSEINEKVPINGIVIVVEDYSNLFNITSTINNCNFFYLKFKLSGKYTNTYLKNSTLRIDNYESKFENQEYIINFTNFNSNTKYTVKIFENDDNSQWIYFKDNVYFTNLSPPEYHYKSNKTITFNNVTCDFTESSSTIKFQNEIDNNNKSVSCSNGNYNSNNLNCIINYNYSFGYHNIYVNEDYKLLNQTFLSNAICDTYFDINISNSSISDSDNNITIKIPNNDFYMKKLENIKFSLNHESNERVIPNGNKFVINNTDYKMDLIVNEGANYEIIIKNIKRMNESWEDNNNTTCLYKEFESSDNNKYYHYLYKSEIPIIYINQNNTQTYPIEINFANKTFADNYKNSFNNIICRDGQLVGTVNCNFNITINQNQTTHSFSLTNLTNSETFKYVSLYSYYGEKCQLISNTMTDIYISVSSPIDLGNITLNYSIRNYTLTREKISNNSYYNVYNFTLSSNVFSEGIARIYAIAEKIYTSPILLSDLGIVFYNSYEIASVNGNLLSFSNLTQEILINFTGPINQNSFKGFKLINGKDQYQADDFDVINNNTSIILKFNSSIRNDGEYELNLVLCDKNQPLGFNVSIITFSSKRYHYVIDNNYNNDTILGLIEAGKTDGLYIEQYLNGSYISKLTDNNNGTYSYLIKNNKMMTIFQY